LLKSRVLSNIGICHYNTNSFENSIEFFKKSNSEDPEFAKPKSFLAKIYE
jgi:Tfp pilus assembly protein PilF